MLYISCLALIKIANHLTQKSGFDYILTLRLQNDPIEHHFRLYCIMSGAQYHITLRRYLKGTMHQTLKHTEEFLNKIESEYVNLKA